MANKQVINSWDDFLKIVCDCYPDNVGNRPCDNGAMCDKCMSPDMQRLFEEERKNGKQ